MSELFSTGTQEPWWSRLGVSVHKLIAVFIWTLSYLECNFQSYDYRSSWQSSWEQELHRWARCSCRFTAVVHWCLAANLRICIYNWEIVFNILLGKGWSDLDDFFSADPHEISIPMKWWKNQPASTSSYACVQLLHCAHSRFWPTDFINSQYQWSHTPVQENNEFKAPEKMLKQIAHNSGTLVQSMPYIFCLWLTDAHPNLDLMWLRL